MCTSNLLHRHIFTVTNTWLARQSVPSMLQEQIALPREQQTRATLGKRRRSGRRLVLPQT
jgi:hypothetical protein